MTNLRKYSELLILQGIAIYNEYQWIDCKIHMEMGNNGDNERQR